jgi:putative endonuclease
MRSTPDEFCTSQAGQPGIDHLATLNDLGQTGEDLAVDFLRLKGYSILARNYRASRREVDVVAKTGNTIVFVEVKARSGESHGSPTEAVGPKKQRQIARVALDYMRGTGTRPAQVRFDVIAVSMSPDASVLTLEHIPNAFPAPRDYFL